MSTAYYAGNWPAAAHFLFRTAFGWHAEAGIHVLRLILSGALDRHPSLKPLSGHWGEFVAGWLDRLDEAIGWGYLDRTVSEYYREHVWATPLGMYSQNQLQFILAEIGAERIIYSEDSLTFSATTFRTSSSRPNSPTTSEPQSLTATPRT